MPGPDFPQNNLINVSTACPGDEEWFFVAVTYNPFSGKFGLSVNGAPRVYTNPLKPTFCGATANGSFACGTFGAGMSIDELSFWKGEIDDERIAKALSRPLQWKVPNDFAGVRRAENTGIPLAMEDSSVSRALHQMARQACGKIPDGQKKKRFGLF